MQDQAFYPVKMVSRSVTRKRTRRTLWIGMGAAFSVGCVAALSPALSPASWVTAYHSNPKTAEITVAAQTLPQPVIAATPDTVPGFAPSAAADTANADAPTVAAPVELDADADNDAPIATTKSSELIASAEPLPAPAPTKAIYPISLTLKVESGDTLSTLLSEAGVSPEDAQAAIESIHTVYDPKKLDIGQSIAVRLDKNPTADAPRLASLIMPISPTANVQLSRQKNDGFTAKKIDAPVEHKLARAGGTIDSSIYETGVSSGLPPALLSEIISAYSYDVDFQRDIKQGDSMDVLFERTQTKDGVATGHGNIIFAELDLGDRELKIYRYVDKSGSSDYYNEHGESIRKALLRTPINGAHITSGYGMRMHPLLGYSKMHRGIDFGAPLGTPIYAAGDGTVDFIGRKGGYGNFLKIKHNAKYASGYGHISRFASGLTPGSKVKQGQIIAYVGSTGMSTGPHLHYEIMINDEQVNPSNVKFKNGNVLQGRELAAFRRNVEQIQANLNATPHNKTDVAMADTGRKKTQAED